MQMPLKRTPPTSPLRKHLSSASSMASLSDTEVKTKMSSVRGKRRREECDFASCMAEMREMFSTWAEEQNKKLDDFQMLLKNLNDNYKQISASLDFMCNQYEELKTKFEGLQKENDAQKSHIRSLEDTIEILQSYEKKSSIEIRNVPSLHGATETKEHLLQLVLKAGSVFKLDLLHADIRDVFRTNSKPGDAVFSTFIVAPLVVSVWRGTWQVMNIYEDYFPVVESYFMGILVHISFALARARFLARSTGAYSGPDGGTLRWLRERILSKVYTYIFVLSNLTMWRGGWGVLDMFIDTIVPNNNHPHRTVLIAALTILFYLSAMLLRSSRNMLASPYFLFTDGKEPTYLFTTRFKTSNSKDTALYVLDCVFSVSVVGSLVVFVWRGSWALLDIFLIPDDEVKSFWVSLAIGYALVVATFSLQVPVRWAAARLHGAPRLFLADAYHLMSFFATVNVWRGVWGLLNVYFFPDSPKLSNWCTHTVSFLLLVLLNCSNSILVRGVYIDAEEPDGECVVFPCHYLRLFVHKERIKKRHKKALAAVAMKPEDSNLPLQPEEKV